MVLKIKKAERTLERRPFTCFSDNKNEIYVRKRTNNTLKHPLHPESARESERECVTCGLETFGEIFKVFLSTYFDQKNAPL